MRIAQLTFDHQPVSARSNHAIFSHVGMLTDSMQDLGNDLSLYGAGDSKVKGEVHSVVDTATDLRNIPQDLHKLYRHLLISKCYNNAGKFDIIHSHYTLMSSYYANLVDTPTVSSIHSPIRPEIVPIMKHFKNNRYISFSLAQRKQMPDLNWIANIYHGIDTELFSYNAVPDDYFFYIGRITEDKGVHLAIEAATKANTKLIIAGRSYIDEGYWQSQIEPRIDGEQIIYVGEADLERKIELYRHARALIFPTQYDEVFGLVMIEAMSCGTPVIGWNSGSVSEVLQDNKTGFVVDSLKDMVQAMKKIDTIKRQDCRERVERYFSVEKMVSGYLKVYQRVIDDWSFKKDKILLTNPYTRSRTNGK